MNRLPELIDHVRRVFPGDKFFDPFESNCAFPAIFAAYELYDRALTRLDDEAWGVLKRKAVRNFRVEREGQLKQGFFNQLNEAFAYCYLLDLGFRNIRFVDEASEKRPDLTYTREGATEYCEVKTIGISDDEVNRRYGLPSVEKRPNFDNNPFATHTYARLERPFFDALTAHIERAWGQIHSVGQRGLVFVLVRFDDFTLDHRAAYKTQMNDFRQGREAENVVIGDLQYQRLVMF